MEQKQANFLAAVPLLVQSGAAILGTLGTFGLKIGAGKSAWSEASGSQKAQWVNALISDAIRQGASDRNQIKSYVYQSLGAGGIFQGRNISESEFNSANTWIDTYIENQVTAKVDKTDTENALNNQLTKYGMYAGIAIAIIVSIILIIKILKK